jgi:uncharacterized membrane protein YidH (DUF202 family)
MEKLLSLSIPNAEGTPVQIVTGAPNVTWQAIVSLLLSLLIVGALLLSLAYLIWGGFDWIFSEGEKQRLEAARNKVWFAIIGLVIVFCSFLIVNTIIEPFLR